MIEKFRQLMVNVDTKKADRCIVPGSWANIYNLINNNKPVNGLNIEFDGVTEPVNGIDLIIEDTDLSLSIIASYNTGNPFIKIIGLETSDIIILENGVWNDVLLYELPDEFKYNHVVGLEEQKALAETIYIEIPKYEETICGLANKIGINEDGIGSNLWVDSTNGNDDNDGYNKNEPLQTIDKALEILNNTSTGDHVITVHIAPGNYNHDTINTYSMNKVHFIGDIYNPGDNVIIELEEPVIFLSSDQLVFRDLKLTAISNNVQYEALCLGLYDCDNFELFHCNLLHIGNSTTLDNIGLLSLINSNGAVVNTELSYSNQQTGEPNGAGGVRVTNNAYFSWNNWDVTCNNLQQLVLNKEGWFFAYNQILTNNNAVPYSCENTIGYYECKVECDSLSEPVNFYQAIHDNVNFSRATLDFSNMVMPDIVTQATEVKDVAHDTGIWATCMADWLEPQTAFVNLYRHSSDYPVYKQGEWASNLVQVLPEGTNFIGAILLNFEEQRAFWESIQVLPSSKMSICDKIAQIEDNLVSSVVASDSLVNVNPNKGDVRIGLTTPTDDGNYVLNKSGSTKTWQTLNLTGVKYLGSVETLAVLPITKSTLENLWPSAIVNDYAIVMTDEEHDNKPAYYNINSIGADPGDPVDWDLMYIINGGGALNPVAYYVDNMNGDDTNKGSDADPFLTIQHALDVAQTYPNKGLEYAPVIYLMGNSSTSSDYDYNFIGNTDVRLSGYEDHIINLNLLNSISINGKLLELNKLNVIYKGGEVETGIINIINGVFSSDDTSYSILTSGVDYTDKYYMLISKSGASFNNIIIDGLIAEEDPDLILNTPIKLVNSGKLDSNKLTINNTVETINTYDGYFFSPDVITNNAEHDIPPTHPVNCTGYYGKAKELDIESEFDMDGDVKSQVVNFNGTGGVKFDTVINDNVISASHIKDENVTYSKLSDDAKETFEIKANKATDWDVLNNTKYPSTFLVKNSLDYKANKADHPSDDNTHTKITYDEQGIVTSGTELTVSDIPPLDYVSKVPGSSLIKDRPDVLGNYVLQQTTSGEQWVIDAVANSELLGSVPTHAEMPTSKTAAEALFGKVVDEGDYLVVANDEILDNVPAYWYVSDITDDTLTYNLLYKIDIDVSSKTDKVNPSVTDNIVVFNDETGNQSDSGININNLIINKNIDKVMVLPKILNYNMNSNPLDIYIYDYDTGLTNYTFKCKIESHSLHNPLVIKIYNTDDPSIIYLSSWNCNYKFYYFTFTIPKETTTLNISVEDINDDTNTETHVLEFTEYDQLVNIDYLHNEIESLKRKLPQINADFDYDNKTRIITPENIGQEGFTLQQTSSGVPTWASNELFTDLIPLEVVNMENGVVISNDSYIIYKKTGNSYIFNANLMVEFIKTNINEYGNLFKILPITIDGDEYNVAPNTNIYGYATIASSTQNDQWRVTLKNTTGEVYDNYMTGIDNIQDTDSFIFTCSYLSFKGSKIDTEFTNVVLSWNSLTDYSITGELINKATGQGINGVITVRIGAAIPVEVTVTNGSFSTVETLSDAFINSSVTLIYNGSTDYNISNYIDSVQGYPVNINLTNTCWPNTSNFCIQGNVSVFGDGTLVGQKELQVDFNGGVSSLIVTTNNNGAIDYTGAQTSSIVGSARIVFDQPGFNRACVGFQVPNTNQTCNYGPVNPVIDRCQEN